MRRGLVITTVRNPEWTLANGHSVVAAAPYLDDRFVLMMADHLFDPDLLVDALAAPAAEGEVILAVDRRLDNPLVDLEDVTRVRTDAAGRIVNIGKLIDLYDAFDTGVFIASQALIEALREDIAEGGAGGISAGMIKLAGRGLARTHDIGARFWLDVDDAVAHGHAQRLSA
jgi:choline kinase